MPLLPDLTVRDRRPELMDQPGLAADAHNAALAGLSRANRLSLAVSTLWRPLAARIKADPERRWRLLDVACGAGDVPLGIARRAAVAGLPLDVAGCDLSETAVAHATRDAVAAGLRAEFFPRNVLADGLPDGFDFVTCSLFLHHLDAPDAVTLLRSIGRAAGTLGVVSDLRRTRVGYAMAYAVTRLVTRSRIVHIDGPLSVRAAFTIDEARRLADESGLSGRVTVRPAWPQRFLMTIEGKNTEPRPSGSGGSRETRPDRSLTVAALI
jgi:2-polyprenyl-3-methyl-5-hydroxy-6-metoxy-1,4-benzoquinol methylase